MKKRYTEEQIIKFLKEANSGVVVKELCRRHGFSGANGARVHIDSQNQCYRGGCILEVLFLGRCCLQTSLSITEKEPLI